MKRIISILLLVFAVAALTGPSLTLGLGLNRIALAHSTAPVVSDGEPISFWSCKGLGGKRVMTCHPDLGVLVASLQPPAPQLQLAVLVGEPQVVQMRWPEAELPPPRRG
ncbi:hypothetical protein VW29_16165 [Devosia limi DSM 17137]|uniref:Uncharacterized protein n=1 Tax=Devosia limi DSM 17137 TaxID=1121477 RepID=A0A0F5LJC0_9HYPH|nr:hypothetical protein [Devosia limi]KKB82506.1 hypothetical protein VW29_16165 [Devosia limi DSM 17137]SHF98350.1 hypothetical protein SAMN02745223_04069 [Devosia limi DSM 17137]